MRRPGMGRHGWHKLADAERRIRELAGKLSTEELKLKLASITDDVLRRAVERRIAELTKDPKNNA